jgi:hypothetical protein
MLQAQAFPLMEDGPRSSAQLLVSAGL